MYIFQPNQVMLCRGTETDCHDTQLNTIIFSPVEQLQNQTD